MTSLNKCPILRRVLRRTLAASWRMTSMVSTLYVLTIAFAVFRGQDSLQFDSFFYWIAYFALGLMYAIIRDVLDE